MIPMSWRNATHGLLIPGSGSSDREAASRPDARGGEPAGGLHPVIPAVREIDEALARVSESAKDRDAIREGREVFEPPLGMAEKRARDAVDRVGRRSIERPG